MYSTSSNIPIKRIIWAAAIAILTFFLVTISAITAMAEGATVITDRVGLEAIADNAYGNYVLGADIDMSGSNWETINYFGGTLDGAGHTISGLTIDTQVDSEGGNVGLFGYLDGTVSHIHFNNVNITARATNGFCAVCVFGSTGSAYGGDPRTDSAHVIDCSVSGQIRISGSGDAYCGAAAFVCAQDSSANLRITIDAANFNEAVLWNCVNCSAEGSMDLTVTETGNGNISLIQSSLDCNVDMDCTVRSSQAASSLMSVYGIYGKDTLCENCNVSGSINYPGRLYGIYGGIGCISNLWLTSDRLTGLSNCKHCIVSGTLGNAGVLASETLCFIEDADDGSAVPEEETEFGNRCSASYSFCSAAGVGLYRFDAFLGRASSISTPFSVPSAGQANVEVNICRLSEEYDVYRHGDVNIVTTTGKINYYCNTANDGNISLASQSGEIDLVGGSSNAGNLTASSTTGDVSALGGLIYNEGSVTVHSNYKASAKGSDGSGAVNRGSITAGGSSEEEIAALGARGENSWNDGSVSASNQGTGPASAVGCDGGVNEGYIQATAGSGKATAFGIRNGIYNSGSVTASCNSDEEAAHANGIGIAGDGENSSAINAGIITAYNPRGVANAYAQGGTAVASGYWAYANGKTASASSHGLNVDNSNGDQKGWIRVWHSEKEHECNSPPPSLIIGADQAPDEDNGFANYDVFATAVGSGKTGEKPAEPEAGMPEEEIPDDSQLVVEMHVYAGKDNEITNSEIDCLYIAKGSYSFDNNGSTDYRMIGVTFVFRNQGEEEGAWNFHVTLPDGFSLSPYLITQETDRAVRVAAGKPDKVTLKVYPIYSESGAEQVDFKLTGDIRRTFSLATIGSGTCNIYCRPTGMMNKIYSSEPFVVPADYNPVADLANVSIKNYNPRLAVLTCALSQAVYNENGNENSGSYIARSLSNIGFSCLDWSPNESPDRVACAIAQKKVLVNGELRVILLVTVRGTVAYEWIGNFMVHSSEYESYHASFRSAADSVEQQIKDYCRKYALPTACTRAVITGHSRGAAVADLVAHDLNTSLNLVNDLVAYTYAAPSCTKNPAADSNIFNIIYAYDVVGFVPYSGFGKYGKNYYIGMSGQAAPEDVKADFTRYTGVPYENVGLGLAVLAATKLPEEIFDFLGDGKVFGKNAGEWLSTKIGTIMAENPSDNPVTKGHSGENYIAWVRNAGIAYTMSPQEIIEEQLASVQHLENMILDIEYDPFFGTIASIKNTLFRKQIAFAIANSAAYTEGGSYFMCYECPVNVEVYDESGTQLVAFQDHNVISENNDFFLLSEEAHDFIVTPANRKLILRVTGTGEGSMHIVLSHFDGDEENIQEIGSNEYIEIPVHTGEVFELQLNGAGLPNNLVVLSSEGNVYFPHGLVPDAQLRLPQNLAEIDEEAFCGDTGIAGMIICPAQLTSIGANAFAGTNFTHIFIPRNVVSIDNTAFGNLSPTVCCFSGSFAESFAQGKGYPVILLNGID